MKNDFGDVPESKRYKETSPMLFRRKLMEALRFSPTPEMHPDDVLKTGEIGDTLRVAALEEQVAEEDVGVGFSPRKIISQSQVAVQKPPCNDISDRSPDGTSSQDLGSMERRQSNYSLEELEESKGNDSLILFCQKSDDPNARIVLTEPSNDRRERGFSSDEKRPMQFQFTRPSKRRNVEVQFDFIDCDSNSSDCDFVADDMSQSAIAPRNEECHSASDYFKASKNSLLMVKHAQTEADSQSANSQSFCNLSASRKIRLSDNDSETYVQQVRVDQFDLISENSAALRLMEYDNVSMASLGLSTAKKHRKQQKQKKKQQVLFAYTPSSSNSQVPQQVMMCCLSDDSLSMYSLPMTPQKGEASFAASTGDQSLDYYQEGGGGAAHPRGKPFLKLDMDKVAEVDDTIIVAETEFEESTHSADEFKKHILNTNLIINKRRDSFHSYGAQRPHESLVLNPGQKASYSQRYTLSDDDNDSETEMIKLPCGTRGLDELSSDASIKSAN